VQLPQQRTKWTKWLPCFLCLRRLLGHSRLPSVDALALAGIIPPSLARSLPASARYRQKNESNKSRARRRVLFDFFSRDVLLDFDINNLQNPVSTIRFFRKKKKKKVGPSLTQTRASSRTGEAGEEV
jgi:hypothetical protein